MPKESFQQNLERSRTPRVNISYEVEIGDAITVKELPFVVGVLGDFTGQPSEPLPKLRDRKFVDVNPEHFDEVLKGMKPHLAFQVENKLSGDREPGKLAIDLKFASLDDFAPDHVARQVAPLRELLELRTKLADLRGSLEGNEKLEEILQATIRDVEKLERLKAEIRPRGGTID